MNKKSIFSLAPLSLAILMTMAPQSFSQAPATKNKSGYAASVPKATQTAVRYGNHERHVLDFWQAKSDKPTPLVFVIHGGGWVGGSKERLDRFADTQALLDARTFLSMSHKNCNPPKSVLNKFQLMGISPTILPANNTFEEPLKTQLYEHLLHSELFSIYRASFEFIAEHTVSLVHPDVRETPTEK